MKETNFCLRNSKYKYILKGVQKPSAEEMNSPFVESDPLSDDDLELMALAEIGRRTLRNEKIQGGCKVQNSNLKRFGNKNGLYNFGNGRRVNLI